MYDNQSMELELDTLPSLHSLDHYIVCNNDNGLVKSINLFLQSFRVLCTDVLCDIVKT